MSGHIRELWDAVGVREEYPIPDHRDIIRRVDAQLDAFPSERKRDMRKLRFAAVLTAAVVALTGAALGVAFHLDALTAFFQGDTTPAQDLLDTRPRSVSDENYTFTVESSVSDGRSAYLILRVDALNETSAQKLMSDSFENMDAFSIYPVKSSEEPIPEDIGVDETTGAAMAVSGSWGVREVTEARTDTSRTWAADAPLEEQSFSLIRVRLGYMDRLHTIEVPLAPAESVTVELGLSGQGAPTFQNPEGGPITVQRATLSPFTCRVEYTVDDRAHVADPWLFFLMADGSLRTQSQMMRSTSGSLWAGWKGSKNYQFQQVQSLAQISALVFSGQAFPLDGGAPFAVTVDPALNPFQVPQMPRLEEGGGYSLPVRALCDGLGASFSWDEAAQSATLAYRGVTLVLTTGSRTALVDGQPAELHQAPAVIDGVLAAPSHIFDDHWGIYAYLIRTPRDPVTDQVTYLDWLIVP